MLALLRFGQQTELDRHGVRRLRVAEQTPGRRDVFSGKGPTYFVCKREIVSFLFHSAEHTRGPAHKLRRMGKISRRDQIGIGAGIAGARGRGGRVQPVAILEPVIPESILSREAFDPIHPGAHALELSPQDRLISIALIEHPWHDHGGISPGSCSL